MTPAQRAFAREALGLPNPSRRSVRNATGAFRRTEEARLAGLRSMVDGGLARPSAPEHSPRGAPRQVLFFHLTRAGAERALEPGERLDPSHFPPIGHE